MNILHLFYDINNNTISVDIAAWLGIIPTIFLFLFLMKKWKRLRRHSVQLNIPLGGIGTVILKPNYTDIQIAHKIWTELVTRKAAIPVDLKDDVILEILNSWYELFGIVRTLIAEIPVDLINSEESTQEIVRIATDTLNFGMRPFLTKWQARFKNWHRNNYNLLDKYEPQEFQRQFPGYQDLMAEMRIVNNQLINYAKELKKIVES